ncbi:MAG: hypothetical protein Q4C81_06160 [Kocuria sp.]|nr:hypothetical protein [Kocuria sp.]
MSIAIFGDSHAGRIKRSWDRTVKNDDRWVTQWFIQRSMGEYPMRFAPSVHDNPQELTDLLLVDPNVFIADQHASVLVVGMGPSMQIAMELAEQFHHPDLPLGATRSMTRKTWESALTDIFVSSAAGRVLGKIRDVAPQIPVTYVPQVRPMLWVNSRDGHIKSWSQSLVGVGADIQNLYSCALEQFAVRFSVDVLDQPPSTIEYDAWTNPHYGFATYGDDTDQYWVRGDYFHSNDAYATVLIDHLRTRSEQFQDLPAAHQWT